jgi:CHAT domain-containing protein/Tfp pilus assembly protein PilF
MHFGLKSLSFVSATLLLSLTTAVPLAPNPLSISDVLAQAPTPTPEDRIRDAVYLNQEGRDDYEKGRPQEALEKFQQALAIFREYKARAGEANSLNNIGEVYYYSLGNYDEALKFYQQALAIRREIGDKEGEWASLDYIGELYGDRNQLSQALESYQQALAIIRQLRAASRSDSALQTSERIRLNNIGGVYFRMGQYDKALASYQPALVIHRESSDYIGEAQTLNNIGVVYVNHGQYQKALDSYEQALKIVREIGDCYRKDPGPRLCYYGDEAAILNNMAAFYFSIGQSQKALEFAQRASEIYNKFKNSESQETNPNNLKLLYEALGQNSQTLGFLSQDLAKRAPVGNALGKEFYQLAGEAVNFNNIGQIYSNLGQYEQALKLLSQALANYKELGDKLGEAITINNIGQVYSNSGQYPKALEFLSQALAIYKEVGDKTGAGVALSNIGQVYNHQGHYPKALEFLSQALALHQEVGDKAGQGTTLNTIANSLLASGNVAEATNKLLRAIEVLESLRPGLNDNDKVAIFETQARTYRSLQQALIAQNKTERALEIAERGRARAFVELLAQRVSAQPTAQSTIPSLTIEQIKQIAKTQNATLVEYSIINDNFNAQNKLQPSESELFIWVIKPTGEVTFKRSDLKPLGQQQNASIQDLVVSSRESIGVRGRGLTVVERVNGTTQGQPLQRLQQLYELLIQPIAELLPTDPESHVIFIPQGELFLVPFDALQDATGKYLIEKHTIVTAPSIQVLDLTHQRRQQVSGKDVLVVGNPTMPSIPPAIGEPPQQLPSLPGAEREASAIAQLLNTEAITGNLATKAAILPKMAQARIIHLATHGLLDDFTGEGVPGAIALAPGGKDNGLLTASEILDLKLNAQLVVLSACDTGRGKITGDSVIGLSRSLISAGVPSVIVSLWSVPDAPTASLMTEFYRKFQQKPDKAQALRSATLTTMKQYPNPRDWAAFTLIGEAD